LACEAAIDPVLSLGNVRPVGLLSLKFPPDLPDAAKYKA
jgi:hypothetical protein